MDKLEFCNFSKLIKSVTDTAGRTKEQLVAFHRYWQSKGLDQSTLSLLKYNTSQQQISHYLSVIRSAMNTDPMFLGAIKGKKYFLKHNTESGKILHDFKDDDLAIIVDGTHMKIEKSSNTQFQY